MNGSGHLGGIVLTDGRVLPLYPRMSSATMVAFERKRGSAGQTTRCHVPRLKQEIAGLRPIGSCKPVSVAVESCGSPSFDKTLEGLFVPIRAASRKFECNMAALPKN